MGGVEIVGGDGCETGSVTKKEEEEKNQQSVSVPASPWTTGTGIRRE